MGVNSLPKTVTRQRRGCDMNQGPSAPESSALTTRLPSHHSNNLDYRFPEIFSSSYNNYHFSYQQGNRRHATRDDLVMPRHHSV